MIVCTVVNDRYQFTVHQDSVSNRAIVYVPDISSSENFVGFSEDEISKLQDLGVRYILIRGIPPGSVDYIEISIGYVMISGMATRGNVTIVQDDNDYSGLMIAILVILAFILVVLGVGVGWYIFSTQRRVNGLPGAGLI